MKSLYFRDFLFIVFASTYFYLASSNSVTPLPSQNNVRLQKVGVLWPVQEFLHIAIQFNTTHLYQQCDVLRKALVTLAFTTGFKHHIEDKLVVLRFSRLTARVNQVCGAVNTLPGNNGTMIRPKRQLGIIVGACFGFLGLAQLETLHQLSELREKQNSFIEIIDHLNTRMSNFEKELRDTQLQLAMSFEYLSSIVELQHLFEEINAISDTISAFDHTVQIFKNAYQFSFDGKMPLDLLEDETLSNLLTTTLHAAQEKFGTVPLKNHQDILAMPTSLQRVSQKTSAV